MTAILRRWADVEHSKLRASLAPFNMSNPDDITRFAANSPLLRAPGDPRIDIP
jgi:hypothetical protein